jgi:hypothetical protein
MPQGLARPPCQIATFPRVSDVATWHGLADKALHFGLLVQRMLRLLNHFTAEEMIANFVHLEQFR